MARQLDEWENSNLSTIMSEKLRIETIIEQMHDAIIGVNEKQEILFINTAAKAILNLGPDKMVGKQVEDISRGNDLFRTIIDDKTKKAFKKEKKNKETHNQQKTQENNKPNLNND